MFPGTVDIHSGVSNHVETVVLLSQQRKPDDYLEVEINLDEMGATNAETKATYEEIKKYVAEHNDGMKENAIVEALKFFRWYSYFFSNVATLQKIRFKTKVHVIVFRYIKCRMAVYFKGLNLKYTAF